MATIIAIPKIRCDNCGRTEETELDYSGKIRRKPRSWGAAKMEGSRDSGSYGGKSRLDFADLCPRCADVALDAAAAALEASRIEEDEELAERVATAAVTSADEPGRRAARESAGTPTPSRR